MPVMSGCDVIESASPEVFGDGEDTDGDELFETTDLSLFELRHRVKSVHSSVFYNVVPGVDSVAVDTAAQNVVRTVVYFDSLGNYVPRRDERIKRDEYGRIVRWEDRRPNLRRVHGGFLKDTLTYRHISPNVVQSAGMGDYAITVYDDNRRVVGQYTDPIAAGEQSAVFNLYRSEDEKGNWTERLSVWTTQAPGSRPHVSYTLTRRDIKYYKD
ncbi:MAG: hypothetical protein J6L68_01855 [Muribaculaceae bacterium]|nr:hypothetical protein [Muribaculaceae bacterium]